MVILTQMPIQMLQILQNILQSMGSSPPSSDYPSTSEVDALLSLEPSKATVDGITVSFKSTDTVP
ncbi:MAG: hypothetical protein KatS3mg129_0835 [Leptospiraceae bacterium]|nr:MAG: hypothetical protein KatS3mg129_0835 [Leptospiraceae bacterium]